MAVTKLWPVTERLDHVLNYATDEEKTSKANSKYSMADYQALRDVLTYAKDEEKTEREFFCQGINCNVDTAREQFVTVKEQFGKPDGIQAYHGYLSFRETDITPELAQRIGMEFAGEVWGKRYQVVVTTHLNTKHLHCHFVLNSISFVDGKRCRDTSWFKFRRIADRICQKYRIYYNPTPNRSKQSSYYYAKEKAGMPTRYSLARAALDEAISCSTSLVELKYYLTEMGYQYQLSESRKYWTVVPKGWEKPIRLANLGEDYTNERIVERLRENQGRVLLKPFQKRSYRPRQYNLPTREHRIKKVGGLYGLYLHYCYKLGYLPKYKRQNGHRLHHLLRDDLMKLDELTEQVRLLGREHIRTDSQLFAYRASLEKQIDSLTADRKRLRNEMRKVHTTDAMLSQAKEEITGINAALRGLRRERKLCDGIAERSGILQSRLETVLSEEEKIQRKETRDYEYRR